MSVWDFVLTKATAAAGALGLTPSLKNEIRIEIFAAIKWEDSTLTFCVRECEHGQSTMYELLGRGFDVSCPPLNLSCSPGARVNVAVQGIDVHGQSCWVRNWQLDLRLVREEGLVFDFNLCPPGKPFVSQWRITCRIFSDSGVETWSEARMISDPGGVVSDDGAVGAALRKKKSTWLLPILIGKATFAPLKPPGIGLEWTTISTPACI